MSEGDADYIGIISAFADEISLFISGTGLSLPYIDYGGRRFYYGVLDGKRIVATISGIGMVNAALTAQMMIDKFRLTTIIFIGIAGAINKKYRIGDVVIPRRWINYQYQKSIKGGPIPCSFNPNDHPNFPQQYFTDQQGKPLAFKSPSCRACPSPPSIHCPSTSLLSKMDIPMYVEVLTSPLDALQPEVPERFFFDVSPSLLQTMERIIDDRRDLPVPILLPDGSYYTPVIRIGDAGLSGDTFLDNDEYRRDLRRQYTQAGVKAEIVDMESTAIAQVAASNAIPFLIIRGVSDVPGIIDIPENISRLAINNLFLLERLLAEM